MNVWFVLFLTSLVHVVERLEERCEEMLKEKKELHDKNIEVSACVHVHMFMYIVHVFLYMYMYMHVTVFTCSHVRTCAYTCVLVHATGFLS